MDGGSGVVAGTVSKTITTEGTGQQEAGTCADLAGNTASSTNGDVNIDKTDPGISFDGQSPAKNANGWNKTDVTLSWTCTDGGSGVVAGTVSKTITTEGTGQEEAGTCADLAGNTASSTNGDVNIDKTDPGIGFDGQSPAKNANGWNKTDVTLSWTCTDGGSGVVAGTVSKTITTEGTGQQEAGTCADLAGNTASSTNGNVNIDKTDPGIGFDGQSPAKNANGWNKTDVTLSWTCTDGGSGVVAGTVSKTITTEGTGQQEAGTCVDLAGNTASSTNGDVTSTRPTRGSASTVGARPERQRLEQRRRHACVDVHRRRLGCRAGTVPRRSDRGDGQQEAGACVDNAGNVASRHERRRQHRQDRPGDQLRRSEPGQERQRLEQDRRHAFVDVHRRRLGCRRRHRLQDDHDRGDGPTGGRDLRRPRRQHGLEHERRRQHRQDRPGGERSQREEGRQLGLHTGHVDESERRRRLRLHRRALGGRKPDTRSGHVLRQRSRSAREHDLHRQRRQHTPDPVTFSGSGADQVASTTLTDNAGNSNGASQVNIDIDKAAPVVAVAGVANGAWSHLGSVPLPDVRPPMPVGVR